MFGEFVGSALIEIPLDFQSRALERLSGGAPCTRIGEVIAEPRLILAEGDAVLWQDHVSSLAEGWSQTFREVVE